MTAAAATARTRIKQISQLIDEDEDAASVSVSVSVPSASLGVVSPAPVESLLFWRRPSIGIRTLVLSEHGCVKVEKLLVCEHRGATDPTARS